MPLAKNNIIPNTEEMCILIEFFPSASSYNTLYDS